MHENQASAHKNRALKTHRCDDRIVSIHQPHVRPIIRGKLNKSVEFGAKMSVSLTAQWFAKFDHIRWDAFNESNDLEAHVVADPVFNGFYKALYPRIRFWTFVQYIDIYIDMMVHAFLL